MRVVQIYTNVNLVISMKQARKLSCKFVHGFQKYNLANNFQYLPTFPQMSKPLPILCKSSTQP